MLLDKTQIVEAVKRLAKHFDTVDHMWPLRIHREAIDMAVGEQCDAGGRFMSGPVAQYGCCCIIGQLCGSYAEAVVRRLSGDGISRWFPPWLGPNSLSTTWPSWGGYDSGTESREKHIREWADAAEAAWIAEIDRRMPMVESWVNLAS